MENWAKKKNVEEENHFQRLPDDVVVNIFDKLSDIKWLCRCLVVSNRFSSLIPLIQTVSIKTNVVDCLSLSGNVCDLEFFAKLTQIRSLNLDLVSDFDANKDSVFKWGAKFTSDLDSLTFLYAASLSKRMESEEEDEEEEEEAEDDKTENEVTQEEQFRRLYLAMDCVKEGLWWLLILSRGIRNYPMLQSITITDSTNKGVRLYLGGEKLVDCRNAFKNDIKCPEEAVPRQESIRVGSVPVLQLPMSGYVMKGVTIVHVKLCRGDDSESDAQLAMVDAFAEERGVFSEAVVQILKSYKAVSKLFKVSWANHLDGEVGNNGHIQFILAVVCLEIALKYLLNFPGNFLLWEV
ncbi:F-box protein AUF2-like [Rhododendron vialii]|uniref:F-box protein AUF2-like n=1 Tax=Rhododendron vialii TaxID=182163 RepID=UPI00265FB665|nr:F-box protein AUF2-like [Rhododendron vialii]